MLICFRDWQGCNSLWGKHKVSVLYTGTVLEAGSSDHHLCHWPLVLWTLLDIGYVPKLLQIARWDIPSIEFASDLWTLSKGRSLLHIHRLVKKHGKGGSANQVLLSLEFSICEKASSSLLLAEYFFKTHFSKKLVVRQGCRGPYVSLKHATMYPLILCHFIILSLYEKGWYTNKYKQYILSKSLRISLSIPSFQG